MGALNRLLPFTYTCTLIGSFALIGFPFLTGYYSKDFILEIASSKYNFAGNFAYWLGAASVSFTTFYSYRLLFLTFINRNNSFKRCTVCAHEAKVATGLPLALLAIGSLFVGYLTKDMIVGLGSPLWANSIFVLSNNMSYLEAEYLPYHIKAIPLLFSHFGIFIFARAHKDAGRSLACRPGGTPPSPPKRGGHRGDSRKDHGRFSRPPCEKKGFDRGGSGPLLGPSGSGVQVHRPAG